MSNETTKNAEGLESVNMAELLAQLKANNEAMAQLKAKADAAEEKAAKAEEKAAKAATGSKGKEVKVIPGKYTQDGHRVNIREVGDVTLSIHGNFRSIGDGSLDNYRQLISGVVAVGRVLAEHGCETVPVDEQVYAGKDATKNHPRGGLSRAKDCDETTGVKIGQLAEAMADLLK